MVEASATDIQMLYVNAEGNEGIHEPVCRRAAGEVRNHNKVVVAISQTYAGRDSGRRARGDKRRCEKQESAHREARHCTSPQGDATNAPQALHCGLASVSCRASASANRGRGLRGQSVSSSNGTAKRHSIADRGGCSLRRRRRAVSSWFVPS